MSLCQCGCGQDAGIYPRTHSARGIVKGQPRRFLPNHQPRGIYGSGARLDRYQVVDTGYATPCYVWNGPTNQKGYALVKVGRSSRAAYLVVYETVHGPVAQGYTVDHLCRVRGCVRVDHLEAVVHAVNVRRGANQKLTRRVVREIQAAAQAEGITISALARRFALSRPTIKAVLTSQHWLAS